MNYKIELLYLVNSFVGGGSGWKFYIMIFNVTRRKGQDLKKKKEPSI